MSSERLPWRVRGSQRRPPAMGRVGMWSQFWNQAYLHSASHFELALPHSHSRRSSLDTGNYIMRSVQSAPNLVPLTATKPPIETRLRKTKMHNVPYWPNFIVPVLAFVVDGVCIFYAFRIVDTQEQKIINLLVIILAMALGVSLGIVITPVSEKEGAAFQEYAKYVTTFLSGYAISKLDPIITAALDIKNALLAFRAMSFLACFILAVTSVYIVRTYIYLSASPQTTEQKPH
jgi:hypothetical protein